MVRGYNDLGEESELSLIPVNINVTFFATHLVDHSVIFSTTTFVPVVRNLMDYRLLIRCFSKHDLGDFLQDLQGDVLYLISLCWSAGRGGWRLVVGIGCRQLEVVFLLKKSEWTG